MYIAPMFTPTIGRGQFPPIFSGPFLMLITLHANQIHHCQITRTKREGAQFVVFSVSVREAELTFSSSNEKDERFFIRHLHGSKRPRPSKPGKSNAVQVGGWDEPVSCANGGFNLLFAGSILSGIHNAVAGALRREVYVHLRSDDNKSRGEMI
jgi:hypothetical protein